MSSVREDGAASFMCANKYESTACVATAQWPHVLCVSLQTPRQTSEHVTVHLIVACQLIQTPHPPVGPRREAGSSSSLTQDGGDYLATVFWVLDLNIEVLLRWGRARLPGEDGDEGMWPSLIEQLFLRFPHSLNHLNSGRSVSHHHMSFLRTV